MGQPTISGTFNNAGDVSAPFYKIYRGGQALITLGAFTGSVVLEEQAVCVAPNIFATYTGAGTFIWTNDTNRDVFCRLRYAVKTSGTPTYALALQTGNVPLYQLLGPDATVLMQASDAGVSVMKRALQTLFKYTAAKVGATAGWVVGAANDQGKLATLPASQTNATLIVPLDDFETGDQIVGFHVNGSIQSGGGTATLTAALRKLTRQANGAAAVDSLIQAFAAPVSVTANTALGLSNAALVLTTPYSVVEGETYYLLLTATTAAGCAAEIQTVGVDYLDQ